MGTQLLIIILILIIPVCASVYCNSTYKKYKRVKTEKEVTGFEVAREILDKNGLKDVHIVETSGVMSDHYDPRRKVIRLSHEVFHGSTVASISIAAHEVGHAIQDKEKYLFMRIRAFIFPIVNIANYFSYILIIISFILSSVNLLWLAIILMSFGVIFQLVTLPVEFDASKRAKEQLVQLGIIDSSEHEQVSKVLTAAALTYVAGLISNLLQLLRLVILLSNRDD